MQEAANGTSFRKVEFGGKKSGDRLQIKILYTQWSTVLCQLAPPK